MMVPAALHALWHFFFGLFEFEHKYMESGFSINLKYLLWGEGIFGPFSAQGPLRAGRVRDRRHDVFRAIGERAGEAAFPSA